ncbi:MAG: hypothetical protein K0U84_15065 [Actinomycetia bacterium]|nr:hypothetical protein [Actinomycetes bacterium]
MEITPTTTTAVLASTPRPKFVYEGNKRTDRPSTDPHTGQILWQVKALIALDGLGTVEGTIRVPQPLVDAELVAGAVVTVSGDPLHVVLRGGDWGAVLATMEGVVGVAGHGRFTELAVDRKTPLKAASS